MLQSELIKLRVKENSTSGNEALKIKTTFIDACLSLDTTIFEPLIDDDQYFQDLDKYRFLQSLKEEFDSWKAKGFKVTKMIEGHCKGCHCGDKVYQFYTNALTPAFAYNIQEDTNEIKDIFMCNLSSGMQVVEMGTLQHYDFWK